MIGHGTGDSGVEIAEYGRGEEIFLNKKRPSATMRTALATAIYLGCCLIIISIYTPIFQSPFSMNASMVWRLALLMAFE